MRCLEREIEMNNRGGKRSNSLLRILRAKKLGLPYVLASCSIFFLVGFLGSFHLSQYLNSHQKTRLLGSVDDDKEWVSYGETGDSFVSSIPFQVLSWKPLTLYFPQFATEEQCRTIIGVAKPRIEPSMLVLREGETVENTKNVRTSSGAFITPSADKTGTLSLIEQKIARATRISWKHGEELYVIRYKVGQRYLSHYDAFSLEDMADRKSQRIASFLLYLSDVEEGGETVFPFENGLNMNSNYDFEKCIGLKVKPRKGDALLFYSTFPNGTRDEMSLHGSCPVIKGEKWVATKWIRDQEHIDYVFDLF